MLPLGTYFDALESKLSAGFRIAPASAASFVSSPECADFLATVIAFGDALPRSFRRGATHQV